MKEFTDRLAEIEEERVALLADMEQAKIEKKQEVIQTCRNLIEETGLDIDEIADALKPPKSARPKPQKTEKPKRTWARTVYALNTDPTMRYSAGPLPYWMRDAMTAEGMKPEDAEDRARFKAECMTVVG
jgi:DNA-binding protein H-NS